MKRLPTREEFNALLKLPYKWDEKRRGLIFTASNGNELLFPAMGYRFDIDVYSINYCGYYWSATPYSIFSAWYFYFDSNKSNMDVYYGNYDRTIRLVSDEPCDNYIDMGIGVYWAQENYHEGKKIYFAWNEAMAIPDKVNEKVSEERSSIIDWEQRRYEIAKAALHGLLTMPIDPNYDSNIGIEELAHRSVAIADELIKQLKQTQL